MKSIFLMLIFIGIASISFGASKDNSTNNQVCKAGIATIMGRDPASIKIDKSTKEAVYLSYLRQDDGTKWKYKCKIDGNQIIWGADEGRWRTHPDDSKVTFKIKADRITVFDTFTDGSFNQKSYTLKQLGK